MSSCGGGRYTGMTSNLENKNVIIYGGAGGIGSAVARTFAREGARLFLVGRTRSTLDAVAKETGAEVAVLDALDEAAVTAHVADVVTKTGSVDVSFNLITRGDVQGIPLLEMSADDLVQPVTNGVKTMFITSRAAARQMVTQGSGVILSVTSGSSAGLAPGMGGTGPADAAVETYLRYLAAEVGPHGVRVAGLWTAGVPETLTREKLQAVGGENVPDPEMVEQMIAGMAMLRRAPRVAQVAETAAFLASDAAAAITCSIVNVTAGLVAR
jgi:NAD(P)-dependent dehydrogenase (short-subunit alcohol dehydrogenase family)